MIFDSHAHYEDAAFDEDREAVLSALPAEGVGRVVNVASGYATSRRCIELARRYDYIYASVGVHPENALELENGLRDIADIRSLASEDKVVAIGEIGLDYHYEEPDSRIQKKWFREQLDLAAETGLPVIVHSREAAEDTCNIMAEFGGSIKAVIHCFSYGPEMVERFLRLGHYIGLGGVLTYKNGKKQKEVMAMVPMDRILLETDCPYMAPEGHRGQRNDSTLLSAVAAEMARIRNMTVSEIEACTYRNAEKFYRL